MNQGYGGPPSTQQGYAPPGGYAPTPGYSPSVQGAQPSAKKGMSPARIALNVIGAIVIAMLAVVGLLQFIRPTASVSAMGGSGPSVTVRQSEGVKGVLGAAIHGTQVVVDEEIAVSASGAQMRGFTLPSPRPVQVVAEGKTHADKGFSLYVMPSDEWEKFEKNQQFRQLPSFEGLKVRSFGHTETLPAGSWAVVVKNSENIFNTMVVHLSVVVDPA